MLYYGDADDKGEKIPTSAWHDVRPWVARLLFRRYQQEGITIEGAKKAALEALDQFHFARVGINEDHIERFNIPENPERPGTYQWEALDDGAAQELIGQANKWVDQAAIEKVKGEEKDIIDRFWRGFQV